MTDTVKLSLDDLAPSHTQRLLSSKYHDEHILTKYKHLLIHFSQTIPSVSAIFKHDREFILECAKRNGLAFRYASEEIQNDRKIVLEIVKRYCWIFEDLTEEFKNDEEIIMACIEGNTGHRFYSILRHADVKWRSNKKVVLAAVKACCTELQFVDKRLKQDPEIVRTAIESFPSALEFVPESFRMDLNLVLECVKKDGGILQHVDPSFNKLREIVLLAVKSSGRVLEFVDDLFKADKEIVLEAVSNSGYALHYASQELRQDRDVVMAAVKSSQYGLLYAHPDLKKDKSIVMEAVKADGTALEHADESLRRDVDIVAAAMENNFEAYRFALKDIDFTSRFIEKYPELSLPFCHKSLTQDKEFVLKCVKKNGLAFQYVDASLSGDRDIVFEAIVHYPIGLFPEEGYYPLCYTSSELSSDRDFIFRVIQALDDVGYLLDYVDASILDLEFYAQLLKMKKGVLMYNNIEDISPEQFVHTFGFVLQ